MKGDFTRNTFDPRNHFSRVLMQQGRVQLDADWNEQAAILLHYLQTLAADLIGPHGGPGDGFKIEPGSDQGFTIAPGHYYVSGFLCENDILDENGEPRPLPYNKQPDYPLPDQQELGDNTYLVYLDVWERHISYVQDDSIREVALDGPDTATRARVVWQVKVWPPSAGDGEAPSDLKCDAVNENWSEWEKQFQPENRGCLKVRAKLTEEIDPTAPCITPPEARYRGAENQLYRVEIHKSGVAWNGEVDNKGNLGGNIEKAATFKWSRDNGSVVFPIRNRVLDSRAETTTVTLEHLGRGDRLSLQEGDWVEIVDDDYVLQGRAEPLLKVSHVGRFDMEVTLEGTPASDVGQDPDKHPLLRRWDHKGTTSEDPSVGRPRQADNDKALLLEEGKWLHLEDGIQIYFEPDPSDDKTAAEEVKRHHYRSGDYWLIPARTATGDIEWPGSSENPKAMPPDGVDHHYAPLAIISVTNDGKVDEMEKEDDCRRSFEVGVMNWL